MRRLTVGRQHRKRSVRYCSLLLSHGDSFSLKKIEKLLMAIALDQIAGDVEFLSCSGKHVDRLTHRLGQAFSERTGIAFHKQ